MNQTKNIWLPALVLITTMIVLFPSLQNGFTNWDDPNYLTSNLLIRSLSFDNLGKIFTTPILGVHNPLTLFTFAIEYQLWGKDNATNYHLVNLLLHLGNTLLVFFFIRLITKDLWASAIAALLFGIHPLHVESVAWISGRKDLLYAVFFLASLISYTIYAQTNEKPLKLGNSFRQKHYLFAIGFFILSIAAKPQAVTLVLVL